MLKEVAVPDIGDFKDVEVAEVLVAPGDRVRIEDPLVVLESDKASMEIPSPYEGVVRELRVSEGDLVSEGSILAVLEVEEGAGEVARPAPDAEAATAPPAETASPPPSETPHEGSGTGRLEAEGGPTPAASRAEAPGPGAVARAPELGPYARADAGEPPPPHASPSVRRLARELGVDLGLVPGSGPKGRIRKEDVQAYVKALVARGGAAGVPIAGVQVARAPEIDFSKYGETEIEPLSRIRKLSSANLHRSWVTVPHVTQFDEADITELEAFRERHRDEARERGFKLTFVPFVVAACARALVEFPRFNSSLDPTGENLVLKRYVHIGVAVDTPHGLVVPVIRNADRKGIFELSRELGELATRARERKLTPEDLSGGTFSISSLGGIGGRHFTPIVNHPEVAILGVSRSRWQPVYREGGFVPRLMLPLSLSYDHRVIDGADAARFITRLRELLEDLRRILL